MEKAFLQAFREVVREQVLRKNEVHLDGLGYFRFEHRNQFQKQYDDGRVVMMPPRDTITFNPDHS
ncbi:MAG: HU family DNA-binding protein [Balneolaceae bacterium]|nr:HU family DNA-binding protein [Balneolaceae bacterium]